MKIAKPRHDSDCTAACIASLLELAIEDLPDFWAASTTKAGQYESVRRWLCERGWHWYYSTCETKHLASFRSEKTERNCSWPPRGYWLGQISRVEWLRDDDPNHMVVMRHRRCVYNPNGNLKQVFEPDVWLIGYYLLVPLDPAK